MSRNLQQRLAYEVGQIFHFGAEIQFQPKDRAEFRAVHLDGPANILRAIHGRRELRFNHLSTAYVAGKRNGTAYEEDLEAGQTFHNHYEKMKLKAELRIRRACRDLGGHLADIQLAAHPEGFEIEKEGLRIFANLPSTESITVMDSQKTTGGSTRIHCHPLIWIATI